MGLFNQITFPRLKHTPHNLSYINQFSLDFGRLTPTLIKKVYPGDKFVHSHEFFMRFAPFVNQVFQNFQVRTEYFFVPSRLLWKNFEAFLTRGVNGSTDYQHPCIDLSRIYDGDTVYINTLIDYLNLPTDRNGDPIDGSGANLPFIDALPFFALVKIMFDYYFDENLYPVEFSDFIDNYINSNLFLASDGNCTDMLVDLLNILHKIQGDEALSLFDTFKCFKRSYPKDYFTSALPFAQRGPIVQIPLNGEGDIRITGDMGDNRSYHNVGIAYHPSAPYTIEQNVDVTLFPLGIAAAGIDSGNFADVQSGDTISGKPIDKDYYQTTTGSNAAGLIRNNAQNGSLTFKAVNVNGTATINDLRTAFAVQQWLEVNARSGVRYKEQLAGHFGVKSRDYRLDRAELLGSYKNTIQIGQTFTTAANSDGSFIPGMGVSNAQASGVAKRWKRRFDEHGYVLGFMSVFPKASYFQGLPKVWTETDVFDYYWPKFQHIGEQEIKRYELYIDDEHGIDNNEVFGYTPRYSHYKTSLNEVHGDFRKSLEFMVDARKFKKLPLLNNQFVNIDVDYNDLYRVFNASAGELSENSPVYVDLYHHLWSKRPMDYFGTPRIF